MSGLDPREIEAFYAAQTEYGGDSGPAAADRESWGVSVVQQYDRRSAACVEYLLCDRLPFPCTAVGALLLVWNTCSVMGFRVGIRFSLLRAVGLLKSRSPFRHKQRALQEWSDAAGNMILGQRLLYPRTTC